MNVIKYSTAPVLSYYITITMRVPNCASILKDWSHHTFISCFFHILRARKQVSSQESKSSIGLGTQISNMRVPFQITTLLHRGICMMLSTFSRTVPSSVYETWILLCFFCQLHHVAFDWLKSHTPFPGPNT